MTIDEKTEEVKRMLYGFNYAVKKLCYLKDELDRVSADITYGPYKSPQFAKVGGMTSYSNEDVSLELLMLESSLQEDIKFEQMKLDKVIELLQCLNENDLNMVCRRFDFSYSNQTISTMINMSREGVRDKLAQIIDKLVKQI